MAPVYKRGGRDPKKEIHRDIPCVWIHTSPDRQHFLFFSSLIVARKALRVGRRDLMENKAKGFWVEQ